MTNKGNKGCKETPRCSTVHADEPSSEQFYKSNAITLYLYCVKNLHTVLGF